jgi:hypothetical protein
MNFNKINNDYIETMTSYKELLDSTYYSDDAFSLKQKVKSMTVIRKGIKKILEDLKTEVKGIEGLRKTPK